ncbi:hypothetical protein JCM3774_003840 [Rhodotorula dairenensis]
MASTAADRRGHVRGESIAQKRSGRGTATAATALGVGLFDATSSGGPPAAGGARSSPAGSGAAAFAIPPRLAYRLIAACVVVLFVLQIAPALLSSSASQTVTAQARHRKARMAGAGESWILPRKWRGIEPGDGPATLNGETLPDCKRVLLYRFQGTHGFSSEIMHYLRAGVIAQKLGYTLLADDSEWNYGALSDYFLPRLIHCRPPADWFSTDLATRIGTRRWQSKDRVWVSRDMEHEMDQWIRDEMLDPPTVDELRSRQHGRILPEGETLPIAFEDSFDDFVATLKEVWRPNAQLAMLVRRQRLELGLGGGAIRHRKNSPTFGGRSRRVGGGGGGAGDRAGSSQTDGDDDEEWEIGVAERSDRGPVVGVHLVGRRPRTELSTYGISGAVAGDLEVVYEGAADAVRRLTHSSLTAPGYSRSRPNIFPPTATPTLVALTNNETLFSVFTSMSTLSEYNIVRTSPPPFDELRRFNEILRLEVTPDLQPPKGNANKLLREWDQKVWNEDVPRELKVLLTRHFVRDLIVMSQHADAFVVSGASPTGRLAILLSGEDGAIGPRDLNGGSFGGRVRSVDGWWSPTARAGSVFGQ